MLRREGDGRVLGGAMDKRMHVSPFMGMDQRYVWHAAEPGRTLSVHIESREDGERVFDATLNLAARPAHAAHARPLDRPLPGGDAARQRADLRARARAEAQGRPGPPQAGGRVMARRIVMWLLGRIRVGRLTVVEGHRRTVIGSGAPAAVVTVHDPRAWRMLLRGGRGMAQAYALGLWDSPDLAAVIRVAARNTGGMDRIRRRLTPVREPYQRTRALFTRNTPRRSRRDIAAHYDLGNDLFELMLDPTMMYSCAYFSEPGMALEEASRAKLDQICRKLDLGPGDRLLEIGTGWGGLAVHAAGEYGCHVTTTTISREQYAVAERRVREAGLQDRVTLLLKDYRELEGTYDKLVSVEMIEAVGWKDFGTFFATCSELLEPDGAMLLQAITMDDRAYKVERASRSFIRTLVFPNGCLPSLEVIARCVARRTDMRNRASRGPHPPLRRDAAPLARERRGLHRPAGGARLRRALPAAVAAVPLLLRGRASPSGASGSCRPCSPSRAGARARTPALEDAVAA